VIGRQALSPLDLEQTFGLIGGDIFHGALTLDQLFWARPLLGLYPPAARGALHDGALRGAPMRALAAELDPLRVELPARALRSVNSESELRLADGELRQLRSIT